MSITDNASNLITHNTRYAFIDGLLCDNLEKVYATLTYQLSFPEYFGNNLDALNDVLGDLNWIKEEHVKLILINKQALLSSLPAQKKEDFLSVLNDNNNGKLKLIII